MPEEEESPSTGRVCYEAYEAFFYKKNPKVARSPQWRHLPQVVRDAWQAGADAVHLTVSGRD